MRIKWLVMLSLPLPSSLLKLPDIWLYGVKLYTDRLKKFMRPMGFSQ